jgi:hypothetical protein
MVSDRRLLRVMRRNILAHSSMNTVILVQCKALCLLDLQRSEYGLILYVKAQVYLLRVLCCD